MRGASNGQTRTRRHRSRLCRRIEPLTTNRWWQRGREVLSDWLGVLGVVAFFGAWELCTRFEIINPFYFPPFSKILAKGYELFANGTIWEHMWFSLTNFTIGFVVSVILGVVLGVPMGWYKNVSKTFDPLLSGIYATPLIALLPLIIMLFGLGSISKIIMTILAAVFPILINTMVGIANTDTRLITMARAFGAKDSQIFLKVSLPGSLPYLVAGMRVALGRALVYIVVAEQYGAATGSGLLELRRGAAFSNGRDVRADHYHRRPGRRAKRIAQIRRAALGQMEAAKIISRSPVLRRRAMKSTRLDLLFGFCAAVRRRQPRRRRSAENDGRPGRRQSRRRAFHASPSIKVSIKSMASTSKSSRPTPPPPCKRCSREKCRWLPARAPPLS